MSEGKINPLLMWVVAEERMRQIQGGRFESGMMT